jgi:anthranilate phosphoribosyltransferase
VPDYDLEGTVRAALSRIIAGEHLTESETESLFGSLMDGRFSDPIKAAILVGLAAKGETADEVAGAARAMRRRVISIPTRRKRVVDTCGTGGDGASSFNISTAAAIVAATAGVPVAKHGNRSVSSRSGSADVLEALGVSLQATPEMAARSLDRIGIAFLFAPKLHPAMKEVASVRRDLGVRTIFNILGPLTNPAGARRQVLGVFEERLVELVARVLVNLGCDHALVVRGRDGLDELTTVDETVVAEVEDGQVDCFVVSPEQFGMKRVTPEALRGGEPAENAALMEEVLAGRKGPLLDITALNAGAALYVGGRSDSLEAGVDEALSILRSGAGSGMLEQMRRQSGVTSR